MPKGWKNPIRRVKAPKLPTEPIETVHVEEIESMLKTCESNYAGTRDKAMILGLLDTGARAKEFLNFNLDDIELATGSIMIRQGKGGNRAWYSQGARPCARSVLIFVPGMITILLSGFQFMGIE